MSLDKLDRFLYGLDGLCMNYEIGLNHEDVTAHLPRARSHHHPLHPGNGGVGHSDCARLLAQSKAQISGVLGRSGTPTPDDNLPGKVTLFRAKEGADGSEK